MTCSINRRRKAEANIGKIIVCIAVILILLSPFLFITDKIKDTKDKIIRKVLNFFQK